MMITGTLEKRSFAFCRSSSPDSPGMRMSLTTTCGVSSSSALERFARRRESLVRDVLARERLLENPAYRAVVIDDPDRIHAARRAPVFLLYRQENGEDRVCPGTLSKFTLPWCCDMKFCASESPSPLPPSRPDHERIEDALADGSGMPGPLSMIEHFDRVPVAPARERHLPRDARAQLDFRLRPPPDVRRSPAPRCVRC